MPLIIVHLTNFYMVSPSIAIAFIIYNMKFGATSGRQKVNVLWIKNSECIVPFLEELKPSKISLDNFNYSAGRAKCRCNRKMFAHMFCLAELLLSFVFFLGKVKFGSFLYSSTWLKQGKCKPEQSLNTLLLAIFVKNIYFQNVSCYTATKKDGFRSCISGYQQGKSLSLVLDVGRQCWPQNLNCENAEQWEVTYGRLCVLDEWVVLCKLL